MNYCPNCGEALGASSTKKGKKKTTAKKASSEVACQVDGCDNKGRTRGYCTKHYQQ